MLMGLIGMLLFAVIGLEGSGLYESVYGSVSDIVG